MGAHTTLEMLGHSKASRDGALAAVFLDEHTGEDFAVGVEDDGV